MRLAASGMRNWTLNGGRFGGSGTDIFCTDLLTCPTLTEFEIDGYITIDGGQPNIARVPWQVLPRRAASVFVSSVNDTSMTLRNPARFTDGAVDSFALVDLNPINCWLVRNGVCQIYSPGMLPGSSQSPVDLNEVGVRSYVDAGVNQRFGLPPAPAGATADEVVAFGITVYDAPFRAAPNVPAKFEVHVDGNRDGVYDYVVFNADLNLEGQRDGRSAVFVKDVNPVDGTQPTRPFYFSDVNFNSQNWILPVPAAAIGVNSSQPFNFYLLAFDAYFGGRPGYSGLWDCSPGAGRNCGSTFHTFQTGQPKFVNEVGSFAVPVQSSYRYTFSRSASGAQASPSQIGFLFLYRDARTGRESDSVELP
jgi:hypothetical protein